MTKSDKTPAPLQREPVPTAQERIDQRTPKVTDDLNKRIEVAIERYKRMEHVYSLTGNMQRFGR